MANKISMEDFIMTRENMKEVMSDSFSDYKVIIEGKLLLQLQSFLDSFELVFGEGDWPTTQCNLKDDVHLISPNGTFINPGVDDESNNWSNRGYLLAVYRGLKDMLDKGKFPIVKTSPCPHKHDDDSDGT